MASLRLLPKVGGSPNISIGKDGIKASLDNSKQEDAKTPDNNAPAVTLLPRYVAVKSSGGYLRLNFKSSGEDNTKRPYLTFSEQSKSRLATHQILYLKKDTVFLRAANGRFWRVLQDGGWVVADREGTPASTDTDCQFEVKQINSNTYSFKSVLNGKYLGGHTVKNLERGFRASDDTSKESLQVTSAEDTALTLPRYVMFKGGNNKFMCVHAERGQEIWLQFNLENNPDLYAAFEVVPTVDGNVAMCSIKRDRFWRLSPNWIWADIERSKALTTPACLFEPIKLSDKLVAFRSTVNQKLCKRYTDYWVSSLCAIADSINDKETHLEVSKAVSHTSIFDVKYLLELAEVREIEALVVGRSYLKNDGEKTADLQAQVTLSQTLTTSQTWSTSDTFSMNTSVSLTAGKPEVASATFTLTIGTETTKTYEFGKATQNAIQFQSTVTVKDVKPNEKANLTFECTKAKCRIPFTYKTRSTRLDGVDLPATEEIDGIFEGVLVYNVGARIGRGTKLSSEVGNKLSLEAGDVISINIETGETRKEEEWVPMEVTETPIGG
ncbi:hypothetical protein SELMODRAFT_408502 [Selaginella moellendorffii]|uniref:Agglutinin domain-containing protein n=1 Tax=Selaginella moellendorffii TaxID=88036 RepID=D8R8I2_SELML|nr:uncharacterized protein LOC9635778 [Selaginella moellendorffii]EFJ32069.1 hypothetical protein SELMODRAFT_408502 [Selaginella moellendorffii]|eukprot:XP_002967470.1 uncharacterized protein LOC9635778 [Selaginella moellendorffii]